MAAPPPPKPQPEAFDPRARPLAIWLGLGALAVILVAIPSTLFDLDRFAGPKELALHLTALGALLILLFRRGGRTGLIAAEVALAGFCLWSALSALFATNHWLAERALAVSVSGAVLFHAGYRVARGGAGGWLLAGLGAALVVGALTGLAQAYGFDYSLLADSRAPGGTLGNRNFLAHLMAIGMPLLLLLLLEAEGPRRAFAAAIGLGLMLTTMVLTRSRASWLAMAGSAAVMTVAWLIARHGGRPIAPRGRLRLIFGAALVGAAMALALPNSLSWRSDSPYRDTMRDLTNYRSGSGRGRVIQYRNSLKLVRLDPIFGTGPGNWPVKYPLVTTRGDPSFSGLDPMPTNPWPSSDWVAFLSERGAIAVLALLGAMVAMALAAFRRLRRDDPETARRSIALLGILTATLIAGAFDAVLLLAPPALLVWASAGMLMPETGAAWNPGKSRGKLAALLALGLVLAAARNAGQLRAIALAEPGWPVERLFRAVPFDPGSYRLQLMLGQRAGCARGASHARAALRLFPHHLAPKRAVARCGR